VPEFRAFKITLLITVQARQPEFLAQQVVFLEPCPQHGKVIENDQLSQVEACAAFSRGSMGEEIDHLALPRGRSAGQEQDVEDGWVHAAGWEAVLFDEQRQ
jgi:hypothetical protein